jgi:hypothetical protein
MNAADIWLVSAAWILAGASRHVTETKVTAEERRWFRTNRDNRVFFWVDIITHQSNCSPNCAMSRHGESPEFLPGADGEKSFPQILQSFNCFTMIGQPHAIREQ